jgi:hypothetical protein
VRLAGKARRDSEVAVSTNAIARAIVSDHGETHAESVPLERWDGPWTADDPNGNFKADVALYAQSDPMTTIRGLAEAVGLPVGALVHYVLARYSTTGSGALLELRPSMGHRLWDRSLAPNRPVTMRFGSPRTASYARWSPGYGHRLSTPY